MPMRKLASWLLSICLVVIALLVPKWAMADSVPLTLFEGFVTRVGTTVEPQWRLWNLGTLGGGVSVDFLDVTLTFDFVGGSQTYSWSDVSPATFVETAPFDPSLVLTGLAVQYTLSQQVFPLDAYTTFTANSLQNTASTNTFPPPLDLFVQGTAVTVVPELDSALLVGTGVMAFLAARHKKVTIKLTSWLSVGEGRPERSFFTLR